MMCPYVSVSLTCCVTCGGAKHAGLAEPTLSPAIPCSQCQPLPMPHFPHYCHYTPPPQSPLPLSLPPPNTHLKVQWSEDVIKADPFFGRSRVRFRVPPWVSNTIARDHLA